MWKRIEYENYMIDVKVFEEPSKFGINNGKISKLYIVNNNTNECVCNYDRGWDVKPKKENKKVYDYAIENWN